MKNLKRIVSMLLVIAMLAAMPVVASAAGVTVEHVHKFEKTTVSTRSWTNPQTEKYTCTVDNCTYSYEVTTMPAEKEYPNDIPNIGSLLCGHSKMKEVVVKDADCVNPGFKYSECANAMCSRKTDFTTIDATGHSWGDWTYATPPTQTDAGVAQRVCNKDASHVETAPVPRLSKYKKGTVNVTNAKVYADTADAADPLGFLKNGTEVYIIGEAGGFYKLKGSQTAWIKISDLTDVAAIGLDDMESCAHNYEDVYTKGADCESKGYTTKKCLNCHNLEFTTTDAVDHQWDSGKILEADKATATTDGYKRFYCVCKDGNGNYVHFDDNSATTDKISFDEADAITKAAILANPEQYPFIRLDKIAGAAAANIIVTVKQDGAPVYNSSAAGRSLVGYLPKGMKLNQYSKSTDGVFILVDTARKYWVPVSALDDVDVPNTGAALNRCSKHNLKEAYVMAATCDVKGFVTKKCTNTNCDYFELSRTDALGHQWDAGRIVLQPTSDNKGIKAYYCLRKDENGIYVHSTGTNETGAKTGDLVLYIGEMDKVAANTAELINHPEIKTEKLAKTSNVYRDCDVDKKELSVEDENKLDQNVIRVWSNYTGSTKTLAGYAPVGSHFTIYKESTDGKWLCIDNTTSDGYWISSDYVAKPYGAEKAQTACTHTSGKYVVKFPATCENPEFLTTYCAQCKRISLAKGVPALGHDWNEWETKKAPTSTDEGEESRTCKRVATHAETRKIPKITDAVVDSIAYVSGDNVIKVYDGAADSHKLVGYATLGAKLTVKAYNTDCTWVQVEGIDAKGNARGKSESLWVRRADITLGQAVNISSPYAGAVEYGTVGAQPDVKVYQMAKMTSGYLASLPYGSPVGVFQYYHDTCAGVYDQEKPADSKISEKEWVRISSSEEKWVRYDQLKKKDASGVYSLLPVVLTQKFTPNNNTLIENETGEKYIAKGHVTTLQGLNVRKEASATSEILGFLTYNSYKDEDNKILIYEIQTIKGVEWGRIKRDTTTELTQGQSGWICLTYVSYEEEKDVTTGGTPSSVVAYSGVVTTGGINLNVRKSADVMSDKVGALANAAKVTIYETAKAKNGVEWGRISQDKIEGWVCMQYVTLNASTSTSGSGSTTVALTPNATVANCSTGVNVRNKSDISGTQLAKIPVGTRIAIDKLENGWGHVNSKGWVYLEYVAFDPGAEDAIRNPKPNTPVGSEEIPVTTYTAITVTGTVSATTASVYAKAGGKDIGGKDTNSVLMILYKDQKVTLKDRTKVNGTVWYKVADGGWVVSTALNLDSLTGDVISTTANVYKEASVDSPVVSVLGAGSKITITEQSGDSIYAWGKVASVGGWIQLHNVKLDAVYNQTYVPAYSNYPSITGSVIVETEMHKEPSDTSETITKLGLNTPVVVQDWKGTLKDGVYTTWGKVTSGSFTGWIRLAAFTKNNEGTTYVEQNNVTAKVTADAVNLYRTCGGSDVALTLRTGAAVTVTEIRLVESAIWGRMVAATDTKKTELWANLSGFQLNGQIIGSTEPVTPAPSTPSTVAPTTITIGIVTGADEVNVRSEAHATSALVTKLKKGTQVKVSQQITSDGAAWAKIEQGWMAMQYINLQAGTVVNTDGTTSVTGTTIMTTVPAGAIAAGFTAIDNLAVRSSAGVGMPQVKTLAKGSSVVIKSIAQANGLYWGQIDEGWICMSYVTVTAVGAGNAGTPGVIGRCFYTVNVRSAAGTGNAITAKIMVSSNVRIYETTVYSGETWGRTDLGWVAMQYVVQ